VTAIVAFNESGTCTCGKELKKICYSPSPKKGKAPHDGAWAIFIGNFDTIGYFFIASETLPTIFADGFRVRSPTFFH